MTRSISLGSLIVLASLLWPAPAAGQMELAVMQGTIKDDSGQPLSDVSVRLRDLERGRETVLKSDKHGQFYRRGLQAVEYEIGVEKQGFQPIKDKVRLVAGTDRRFDFTLARSGPAGSEEFTKGVEAFNRGDVAAAIAAFEAAVQKSPHVPETRVNLALAYLKAKRAEDAVTELQHATALKPDQAGILFQLGGAYVELQKYDEAIAAFEQGLAGQADLASPLVYEAVVTLGAVYFAKGDNDKAATQFTRALAGKPGAAAPALGLAKVHFSKGDADKALELFNQVVAVHPGTPEAAQAEAFLKELRKSKGGIHA